jgi:hypothetical protein
MMPPVPVWSFAMTALLDFFDFMTATKLEDDNGKISIRHGRQNNKAAHLG